jgi:hypothetical protein
MNEEGTLREAVKTAWAVYVATHPAADIDDQLQCSLSRHLEARMQAGEKNLEEASRIWTECLLTSGELRANVLFDELRRMDLEVA